MDTDTAYCRSLVEGHDRDRYILTMAASMPARAALWALFAFNHELAKTREITREPQAGHVRLAWWHEKISAFYAGEAMPAHDVARALGHAIKTYDLPQEEFMHLIDARGFDMEGHAPASLDGLCTYADATNTPLIALCANVLGVDAPGADMGIAWGLTGIIRALPFLARQNRCMLPLPMLHEMGLMPEQFHHLSPSPALAQAVATIAARAQMHIDRAGTSPRFFKAQAKMTNIFLKRIAASGNNPFDPRVSQTVPFLGLRVLF